MKVGCAAIVNAPTKRSFERRELASCLFRKTDQQTRTRFEPGGMMAWGIDRATPPLNFKEETCVSIEEL